MSLHYGKGVFHVFAVIASSYLKRAFMHADQKYIDALATNDAGLLKELYRKFACNITRMVVQNRGTEMDAADIFQEALLSIYTKARNGGFVLSCPLDAFLHIICKNIWLKELEKRKHRETMFCSPGGYVTVDQDCFRLDEEYWLLQARRNLVQEKLALLGETSQKLLRLSWSGNSMGEVAKLLKVTHSYARKKKSCCLAKLVELVRQSPQFDSLKW